MIDAGNHIIAREGLGLPEEIFGILEKRLTDFEDFNEAIVRRYFTAAQ